MEQITDAAILITDINGKRFLIRAMRHNVCFLLAYQHQIKFNKNNVVQGFWTDRNRFIDRMEAATLALSNGQVKSLPKGAELFSEDLW